MSKKSTFLTALCGAVLGALVVGVIPAVGAPGDPLILGQNNNGGGQTTKATSNVGDGPGFQFTNNAGGVLAAARINTGCVVSGNAKFGCAPGFATDTRGLVKHFNSDYLDGLGGEDYQVIAAGNSTQEAGTGTGVLTADITAPRTGVIQATADAWLLADATGDNFQCELDIPTLPGAPQTQDRDVDIAANEEGDCSVTYVAEVPAGTHTVSFNVDGVDAGSDVDDAALNVIFVPQEGGVIAAAASAADADNGDE